MIEQVTDTILEQAFEAGPAVYGRTRDELVAQVRDLPGSAASMPVLSCPGWSVKDVVSHVTGLVADLLGGARPPLGTDEKTARQVAERSHMTLREVCDEWMGNGVAFAEFLTERPRYGLGLTGDLTAHAHDIADTVAGIEPPWTEAALIASHRYVPLLQERVAERLDVALTVTLDDLRWEPDQGTVALALLTSPSEFLCSVTGRRTRAQVDQLQWVGDPAPMLDSAFTQYGPYRPASHPVEGQA